MACVNGGNRLAQHRGKIGDGLDRAEAFRALRRSHGGDVDVRLGDSLADPAVLDRAVAHARDALLMQFVIEERAVVGDHEQERDLVVHRGPDRGDAHQEVAVAADRDRHAAGPFQRQRRADRDAGSAADAAAAIGTEVIERMAKRDAGAVPRQRQVRERYLAPLDRVAQRRGHVVDRELVAGRRRQVVLVRGGRALALAERSEQGGHRRLRLAGEEDVDRRQALIVHAPAIVQLMIDRDLDHLGAESAAILERAGGIEPVEAEDHVGVADRLDRGCVERHHARRADMQRVIGREGGGDLEIGDDLRAEPLGKFHARIPSLDGARAAAGEDERMLGVLEQACRLRDEAGVGGGGHRRHQPRRIDRRDRLGELLLLHAGVEVDVGRPLGRGIGDPVGAQHGFASRARRGRLVVPFGVAAHQPALVGGGMDPVDPRPALAGVDRPGGAEDDDRHAVAPGVEDRHRAVHQPDIGMDCRPHRAAGDLGIAVRDSDRRLLVQAQQHLRCGVAEIVHERVVQAAIARAGIERDVGDAGGAQRVCDDVAAEARRVDAGGDGTVDAAQIGGIVGARCLLPGRCHGKKSPGAGQSRPNPASALPLAGAGLNAPRA